MTTPNRALSAEDEAAVRKRHEQCTMFEYKASGMTWTHGAAAHQDRAALLATLDSSRAELGALVEALQPFAKYFKAHHEMLSDETVAFGMVDLDIRVGDLRRAAKAIADPATSARTWLEKVAALQAAYDDERNQHGLTDDICNAWKARAEAAEAKLSALSARKFTIMDAPDIPWSLIEPHEKQAQINHSQSLETLHGRGGLSASEAVAVLEDHRFRAISTDAAKERLAEIVQRSEAKLSARVELTEADSVRVERARKNHAAIGPTVSFENANRLLAEAEADRVHLLFIISRLTASVRATGTEAEDERRKGNESIGSFNGVREFYTTERGYSVERRKPTPPKGAPT